MKSWKAKENGISHLRENGPRFDLGFFGRGRGGESILKKFSKPRSGQKNFLGLLGGPGHAGSENFGKRSVQDWLKLHLWMLVAFTSSFISLSSSNKITI